MLFAMIVTGVAWTILSLPFAMAGFLLGRRLYSRENALLRYELRKCAEEMETRQCGVASRPRKQE